MATERACSIFVTGTDTGIGKTRSAVVLMEAFKSMGKSVAGMKPIASGSEKSKSGLTNLDAMALLQHATSRQSYEIINPYAFAPPIAPHIAAQRAGVRIDPDVIRRAYETLAASHDCVVVEGVGGWRVPFSPAFSTVDLVRLLDLPVVLVVGLRLGCINHALLSHEAIRNDNVNLAGWIANLIDPDYGEVDETVQLLEQKITAPLLGILPFVPHPDNKVLANNIKTERISL